MLNHREAMWELFWMVFHDQPRSVTFHHIRKLGFSRRAAAEMIQDAEREG